MYRNNDSLFIAKMEQVLNVYALPYDDKYPVVCFDERPCFLINNTIELVTMESSKVKKEYYAYEKMVLVHY